MGPMEDMQGPGGISYDDVKNIMRNNETPMEKEAGAIWSKLDHLAASDPKEYKKFIDDTLKEGKEYMKDQGEEGKKKKKPNMPISRFWVETMLLDMDKRPTGIPRYFNICESETMEFTDDKNFNMYMSDLDNRQIDCVIHPFFMKKCLGDNLFMHDALMLVFSTYESDHVEKEFVKRQYEHHAEPKKLRMKPGKGQGGEKEKKEPEPEKSVLDTLSRVAHSDAARKMARDEEVERRRSLFEINKPLPKKGEKPKAKEAAPPPPVIEEVEPTLEYEITETSPTRTVLVVSLPEGLDPSGLGVAVESQGETCVVVVEAPGRRALKVPLGFTAAQHTAKLLRKKRQLKVELTAAAAAAVPKAAAAAVPKAAAVPPPSTPGKVYDDP